MLNAPPETRSATPGVGVTLMKQQPLARDPTGGAAGLRPPFKSAILEAKLDTFEIAVLIRV